MIGLDDFVSSGLLRDVSSGLPITKAEAFRNATDPGFEIVFTIGEQRYRAPISAAEWKCAQHDRKAEARLVARPLLELQDMVDAERRKARQAEHHELVGRVEQRLRRWESVVRESVRVWRRLRRLRRAVRRASKGVRDGKAT